MWVLSIFYEPHTNYHRLNVYAEKCRERGHKMTFPKVVHLYKQIFCNTNCLNKTLVGKERWTMVHMESDLKMLETSLHGNLEEWAPSGDSRTPVFLKNEGENICEMNKKSHCECWHAIGVYQNITNQLVFAHYLIFLEFIFVPDYSWIPPRFTEAL